MNSYNRGVLIGMVLGDGCIHPKRHILKNGEKKIYHELSIKHSKKQEAYLEHKRDLFHSIMGGRPPNIRRTVTKLGNRQHDMVQFSKQHKYFTLLYRWIYPNNKKTYTRRVLDYLNPQGIALWYKDDGTLIKCKNKAGKVSSVEMRICTFCSSEEADTILEYFNEVYGILAKKRHCKKTDAYYIAFNTKESKQLELLIKPYMTESMYYKLPSKWVTRAQRAVIE